MVRLAEVWWVRGGVLAVAVSAGQLDDERDVSLTKLRPRRVAIVPVFNEESTVVSVLASLQLRVDHIVVINDGSTDGTERELEQWKPIPGRVTMISFPFNRGVSHAYDAALTVVVQRLGAGQLDSSDLVVFIDADGQHDLRQLDRLIATMRSHAADVVIARRDLSYLGWFKRVGNRLMSAWASVWAGCRLTDVESGYRIVAVGPLMHASRFVRGFRYSQPAQMAVALGRLGYVIDNTVPVTVPVARSRTRLRNAAVHFVAIPWTAVRATVGGIGRGADCTSVAPGTLSGASAPLVAVPLVAVPFVFGVAFAIATVVRIGLQCPRGIAASAVSLGGIGFLASLRRDPGRATRMVALLLAPVEWWLSDRLWSHSTFSAAAGLGAGITAGFLAAPAKRARLNTSPSRHGHGRFLLMTTVAVWVSALIWSGANNPAAAWFGGITAHGSRSSDMVAITFDDGPNDSSTLAVADLLASRGARATFFMVGAAAEARPQLVRELVARGQLVGNHSFRHQRNDWLDPSYPELARAQQSFARVLHRCPTFFRPPYGRHTPSMSERAEKAGMSLVTWDVAASDWTTSDPSLIARRVLARLKPGSIVLLHDGSNGRPTVQRPFITDAVRRILDGLDGRHLRAVGLDELLGKPAWLSTCEQ